MKILIITIGSRGDVQPYVALGKGLKAAGHEVTVCTAWSFEGFVEEHGLRFAYMDNDLVELLTDDVGRQALEDMQGPIGTIKTAIRLIRMLKPVMRRIMSDVWDAAREFEPDFLVYNSKVPGVHIAEKLGMPCALAMPFPQFVATGEFPTIGMPDFGAFTNRASYKIVQLFTTAFGGMINEFRTDILGLEKTSRFIGLHHMTDGTPVPVLHCYSETVVPRPADWPACAYVTGYWFLDEKSEPSDELVSFLEKGDPPVYVGFGSMSGRKPEKVTKVVVESLEAANVRGIIATGWGGLEPSDLPDSILKIDQAPHDWLFPRVSAVVHHGGAGTTAAGLRAGRPTVICPFFGDQGFWGKRVFDLRVGSKPIPQRKLSVGKLGNAIRQVTTDRAFSKNASRIGKKIRSEDGVKKALVTIEQIAAGEAC